MDTTVGFQARNNCPASIKGAFPFRVGTSSYIMPAGVLENIRHLAGLVDDIEIVLFESAEISLQPAAEEMRQIAEIGATSNLTFTIHMPLDARLGSADRAEREKSVLKCLKTIDLAQPLSPFAYVMHLDISQDADGRPAIPSGGELTRWRRAIDDSISAVLRHGVRPELICVETLFYPIKLAEEVILDHGLSVCLDVGHILLSGESFEDHLDRYLERTRVIHLHGIINGKDHCDLTGLQRPMLTGLLSRLAAAAARPRVLTVEVFNEDDFNKSMQVLGEFVK